MRKEEVLHEEGGSFWESISTSQVLKFIPSISMSSCYHYKYPSFLNSYFLRHVRMERVFPVFPRFLLLLLIINTVFKVG